MQYVTEQDLEGVLTTRELDALCDNKPSAERLTLLAQVNEQAVAEVEGFLRGKYELPLQEPIDRSVKTCVLDLMKYRLYERRDANRISDSIMKVRDRAIFHLKDVRKGAIVLAVPQSQTPEKPKTGTVQVINKGQRKFKTGFTNWN